MRIITILLIGIAICISTVGKAEEEPNLTKAGTEFYSISNLAKAVMDKDQKSFTVLASNGRAYTSYPKHPALQLGKLYITDNGRYVTWVLAEPFYSNYCPAKNTTNDKNEVITDVKWEELPAVLFYRDGELRKSYLLSQLMPTESLMTCKDSHVCWLKGVPYFDSRRNSLQFETLDNLLYNFSPKTGDIFSVNRVGNRAGRTSGY